MNTVTRRSLLKAGACALASQSCPLQMSGVPAAAAAAAEPAVTSFRYHAPQSALDDLRLRLRRTRLPDRQTCNDWSQGIPLAQLQALLDYWQNVYDWRRCEARLNAFPQYRTQIDGLGIHFLHVRSPHPQALPLLITHGWPGSVIEFLQLIRLLTNPTAHGGRAEDAFHVVAPSLPGFAFSDKPTERGWNVDRIAAAWAALMQRLGYSRYVAQGGDWGAWVTTRLAQQRAPGLLGIHLNMPLVFPSATPANPTPAERRALARMAHFQREEFGFFQVQQTQPQMIGYALADSPSGQLAWIIQILYEFTDNGGDLESALPRDEILDNVTLYWLTDTAASSARIYLEDAHLVGGNARVIDLPVGYSVFPRELYRAPRAWARACYPQLIYWHELDRGGHFAAWEQPELFAQELRACFGLLRAAA
ncbi:MAG TPA: epoxide hydrolase [Steroidobacteraceae bacterium]|nr:epoxide hydrolase [Steroidobacteraceae bacterium]